MFSVNSYKAGIKSGEIRKKCNNTLIDLLNAHPEWEWQYDGKPSARMDEITSDIDRIANWKLQPDLFRYSGLSANPNMTREFIDNHPDLPWDWVLLWANPSVYKLGDPELINAECKWFGLSQNPTVTWEFIRENINQAWNWEQLSRHSAITFSVVMTDPLFPGNLLNPDNFSLNLSLTPEIVGQNPEFTPINSNTVITWNWENLSVNPYIVTLDFLTRNTEKKWDWPYVARNHGITVDCLEEISKKGDYLLFYGMNPSIVQPNKISMKHWSSRGHCALFSYNANTTWNCVKDGLDQDWFWSVICRHPNISISDLETIPDMRTNMIYQTWLMNNPGLTVFDILKPQYRECLEKNYNRSMETLSSNKFLYNNVAYARIVRNKRELRRYLGDWRKGQILLGKQV